MRATWMPLPLPGPTLRALALPVLDLRAAPVPGGVAGMGPGSPTALLAGDFLHPRPRLGRRGGRLTTGLGCFGLGCFGLGYFGLGVFEDGTVNVVVG